MTYMRRQSWFLILIDFLLLATLVFGGAFVGVPPHIYMTTGAVWCGVAGVLYEVQSLHARHRLRDTHGHVCRRCNYDFGESDATHCPDCQRPRPSDESRPLM